jgi:hypothetical protein
VKVEGQQKFWDVCERNSLYFQWVFSNYFFVFRIIAPRDLEGYHRNEIETDHDDARPRFENILHIFSSTFFICFGDLTLGESSTGKQGFKSFKLDWIDSIESG